MAVKAKDLARALRHARNAHSRLYESTPDVEGERPSTYLGVEGRGRRLETSKVIMNEESVTEPRAAVVDALMQRREDRLKKSSDAFDARSTNIESFATPAILRD